MYLDLRHYQPEEKLPQPLSAFLEQDFHRTIPFGAVLLDYCQQLSARLSESKDADVAALGFWLRPAHINELKKRFEIGSTERCLRTPKGLIFHVTASNVDTLFAYSWILSLVCGNGNLVRLPSVNSPGIATILGAIQNLLEEKHFQPLNRVNCFVYYGHQEALTNAISAASNMRVIWGSNTTIQTLRHIPLNPYATEIAFPDRFSYGAIEASKYQLLSAEKKRLLAQFAFRDIYGFDQNGCSSPRLLFWVGTEHHIDTAVDEFSECLHQEIQSRGYEVPLSAFMNKQTQVYVESTRLPIRSVTTPCNELTNIVMKQFDPLCRTHPGAGLLYHVPLRELSHLTNIAAVQDQTVVYEGFDQDAIEKLALSLNGRGPSRFVPFGEALRFAAEWDGHDLLQAFTRKISLC